MTVSQSALENLSESCSNIENGEWHVLISFARHECMVRSCPAPMKLMRALLWAPLGAWWDVVVQDGSCLQAAHAAWCLALAALSLQLQRGFLLHMIFFITCMESPFTSVRIYALNACRGVNRNVRVDASGERC